MIPPGLRHEYWVELSVGQAGRTPLAALLIAPFLGAWLGVLGGGLARKSPGTRRRGVSGPHALSPPQPPGRLMASDADREKVIDMLTAAFARGRLTKEELDLRAGRRVRRADLRRPGRAHRRRARPASSRLTATTTVVS